MKNRVMDEVKRMFKPEFLNRIDEIMVFHPLNKKNIEEIAGIMLKTIIRRTKAQVGMSLTVDDGAVAYLAEKGYDEKYGARPLRRTIQNQIEDKLSEELLEGHIKKDDEVLVTRDGEGLKFTVRDSSKENKILVK
jgi:ATP-dependent Clp protease ATP-binding subunit ClpC